MLIKEIMTQNVVSIHPSITVREAKDIMWKKRVRHVPVLNEDKKVVGVFTEHDIFQALAETDDEHSVMDQHVSSYMSTDVIAAHPSEFVEDLGAIFYENRIGMVPIVEHQKLVGVLTRTDLLYTLVQLTGAHQPSSIIEVQVKNISGQLAKVTNMISTRHINIASVLIYPGKDENTKVLLFRVQTMNPNNIAYDLTAQGYTVLWPLLSGKDATK